MPETIKLHMGFINTPYTKQTIAAPMTSAKAESSRKRRRSFSKTMTAEAVAGILEGRYGVVEMFQAIHAQEIHSLVVEGFAEIAADFLSEGKPFTTAALKNLMKPNTKQVEAMFRSFLDREEMNGMAPGVPTLAAMRGVRHGRGSKTKRGMPRPSFIDTGIYKASFRCWAE
jgi:hypothetical protein